jgi:hypothetical protein
MTKEQKNLKKRAERKRFFIWAAGELLRGRLQKVGVSVLFFLLIR